MSNADHLNADVAVFQEQVAGYGWRPEVFYEPEEVVFEWALPGRRAVVSLEGDGFLSYAMLVNGEFVPGQNASAKSNTVPSDLAAYLSPSHR